MSTPLSPPLPWKTRIYIALLSAASDVSLRRDGTVNRRLFNFLDARAKPNPQPIGGVKSADFYLDPAKDLWLRVYSPTTPTPTPLPLLLFFHGGGFVFLSPASKPYDAVTRRLAREINAVVVSVNYRLAPEHKLPAPYDDGFEVLKWIERNPTFEGFAPAADVEKVFLAGDSAGGNIVHHLGVRYAAAAAKKEFSAVRVMGMVAIQPFLGGEEQSESEKRLEGAPLVSRERTNWMWKASLPEGSDRDDEMANIYGGGGDLIRDLELLPPAIVFIGGFDPLQDRQRKYAEWLKELGKQVKVVEYEDAIHAFYIFPELPQSSPFITEEKGSVCSCVWLNFLHGSRRSKTLYNFSQGSRSNSFYAQDFSSF